MPDTLLKGCLFFLLGFCLFLQSSFLTPLPSALATSGNLKQLENQRQTTQQRLKRIKRIKRQLLVQERQVTSNILKNQQRLEDSSSALHGQEKRLASTKQELAQLEKDLDVAIAEQKQLAYQVGKRVRSLYMGENLSFLEALLQAGNLTTLLDRYYYKKRIVLQDKALNAAYVEKTQALQVKREVLAQQKTRVAETILQIHSYQGELQEAMVLDKMLVQKLRTSREAYEMAEDQLQRESYTIERQILSLTRRGGPVIGSTGLLVRPIVAAITSSFGYRTHPIFRTRRFHSGIDFGAKYGSAIHAADGGRVIHAGWQGGYGKVVIINHGTQRGVNLTTLYGHMSRVAVRSGQSIGKGQVVGYVGSTGFSTGPHLHFEVRENGRPVNPSRHL